MGAAIVREEKEQMICERKRGGREATSGFRGINKWKKDEQQVERAGATGGNRMSNRWRMESQQVENGIATGGDGNNATSGSS